MPMGMSFQAFSANHMETIATLYELQAMADGPTLPVRTSNAKTPQSSSLQRYYPCTKAASIQIIF